MAAVTKRPHLQTGAARRHSLRRKVMRFSHSPYLVRSVCPANTPRARHHQSQWERLWHTMVPTSALASRDPVVFPRRLVEIVGFESAADDSAEDLVAVENRSSSPVECHASDARLTSQGTCLALDIHDLWSSTARPCGGCRLGRLPASSNLGCERHFCSGWSLRHDGFLIAG